MPKKDSSHDVVKKALAKNGWKITDDPYVISFGERFLFVDLGAEGSKSIKADYKNIKSRFIGACRKGKKIAVEIKEFIGKSAILDLEQALGQYVLYSLLLGKVDPEREMFLAITDTVYDKIFSEPIGELVIQELPMKLLVIEREEIKEWITPKITEK